MFSHDDIMSEYLSTTGQGTSEDTQELAFDLVWGKQQRMRGSQGKVTTNDMGFTAQGHRRAYKDNPW